MDRSKILFLSAFSPEEVEFNNYRKQYGISACEIINKKNIFTKIILFLGYYLFSPLMYFVYGKWKNNIDNYEMFIINSRRPSKYALKMIAKKNKKIVVVYWNKITKEELNIDFCKKYTNAIYSFDLKDAQKFNLLFCDTYTFSSIYDNSDSIDDNIAYYFGKYKTGRDEILKNLENQIKDYVNVDFNLVYDKKPNGLYASDRISYKAYLNKVKTSKIIVEIVSNNQSGLTLRSLEALYFEKKLITNNDDIVNYKIYNKNNIFIIGKDKDLSDFIKCKNDNLDFVKEYYDFNNWLNRIIYDFEDKNESISRRYFL